MSNSVIEFKNDTKKELKRGEIYNVYFTGKEGTSKQSGWRPAVIVGNAKGIKYSTVFRCIPITSQIKRLDMPTHVLITSGSLKKQSMALVESEESIPECDIANKISALSEVDMDEIDYAIFIAEGLHENKKLLSRLMRSNNYKFA